MATEVGSGAAPVADALRARFAKAAWAVSATAIAKVSAKAHLWRAARLPVLVYAVLALLLYWPVGPLSTSRLISCGCEDPAQSAWFLAWVPHALLNHLNPFFTNEQMYPTGLNVAANNAAPLLGIIATPVILTLGPVAAMNIMLRLAFVLSASAMYFLLGRFVSSRAARFVGGLMFGFCPYMIAQGSYHLPLVFVPILPLILVCLDELLLVRSRKPWAVGLVLGGLCAAQYLISAELLADLALLVLVATVVLALSHPRATSKAIWHVLQGLLAAVVPFAAVCGYPIWFDQFGPEHLGPATAIGPFVQGYSEDVLSAIIPTSNQLLGSPSLIAKGSSFVLGNLPENGGYLGVTLILVCLVIVVVERRSAVVRYSALLAVVAWWISLGLDLDVNGHNAGIWMPYDRLASLPLLTAELPARYSLFVELFLAVVLAAGLDRLVVGSGQRCRRAVEAALAARWARDERPEDWRTTSVVVRDWRRVEYRVLRFVHSGAVQVVVVSSLALVPLLPRGYSQPPTQVPTAFLSSATAASIPRNGVVLTYPFTETPNAFAILWQAVAQFRFKLIGGYGINPDGGTIFLPRILPPVLVTGLLESAWDNAPLPPLDTATFRQIDIYCIRWHVAAVLVVPISGNWQAVDRYFDGALGSGETVDGVTVWLDAWQRAERAQRL